MEHTKGECRIGKYTHRARIYNVGGCERLIADCSNRPPDEARANARRLALCWNSHDKLIKQRDELKEALQSIYGMCDCKISDIEIRVRNIANEAISKAGI